ncbi:MAG: type II toxin-antitoxin system HicB family antitoxin [Planctomycetes bacterium]|nr:type II toxin-antitoxin system HicB family antitoxin [Planctomycetota bacterium]
MERTWDVLVERDGEGWLVASVPALPGCHTQARTFDELLRRIEAAIRACLAEAADEAPTLEFVGLRRVRVP